MAETRRYQIFRSPDQDDSDGYTYSIQFRTGSLAYYEAFCQHQGARFNQKAAARRGQPMYVIRVQWSLCNNCGKE